MAGVPDFTTIAANAVVFAAAIGAAAAGSLAAVKVIKNKWLELFDPKDNDRNGQARVTGGVILENTSMLMWSESMRDLREAIEENTREQRETRHEMALDREARRHR